MINPARDPKQCERSKRIVFYNVDYDDDDDDGDGDDDDDDDDDDDGEFDDGGGGDEDDVDVEEEGDDEVEEDDVEEEGRSQDREAHELAQATWAWTFTRTILFADLQEKWPRTPSGTSFFGSLRSRNAHGQSTRAIFFMENFRKNGRGHSGDTSGPARDQ